jgi:hypothetical protein
MKKSKRLYSTDSVDDDLYMCAELHIDKSFKDGLEFIYERQSGIKTRFTVYRDGIESLRDLLDKWLGDEKNT